MEGIGGDSPSLTPFQIKIDFFTPKRITTLRRPPVSWGSTRRARFDQVEVPLGASIDISDPTTDGFFGVPSRSCSFEGEGFAAVQRKTSGVTVTWVIRTRGFLGQPKPEGLVGHQRPLGPLGEV